VNEPALQAPGVTASGDGVEAPPAWTKLKSLADSEDE